jgi:uncharacterized membrane protein YeiH
MILGVDLSIINVAEIIGLVSFAFSGLLIAIDMKLDLLGIFISSFLTALGGGVVRDIIVGRDIFALTNNYPSILILFIIFLSLFFHINKLSEIQKHPLFSVFDTIGLVSFAISGATIAVEADFALFGVMIISFITAVGGGVMRDILINKVPIVLVSEFYGSVALAVGFLVYMVDTFGFLNSFTISLIFIFGLWLRFLALKNSWHLPRLYKEID